MPIGGSREFLSPHGEQPGTPGESPAERRVSHAKHHTSSLPFDAATVPNNLAATAAGEKALTASAIEAKRVGGIITDTRNEAARMIRQADIVERLYSGEFLRDFDLAAETVTALAQGKIDEIPMDVRSFAVAGDTPEAVREYMSHFTIQSATAPYPFPRVTFPTTAIFTDEGKECHVEGWSSYSPLSYGILSPTFAPEVRLPVLVDTHALSLADFDRLDQLEPGHARNIQVAYEMALAEQKQKGAEFTKEPQIIRLIAALPVGYDYTTDFLPDVELPNDKTKAYDPYLLYEGELNRAGDYLQQDIAVKRSRIPLSVDGKQTFMRARRPLPGGEHTEGQLLPTPGHEQNRMAIILFPYTKEEAPRRIDFPSHEGYHSSSSGLIGIESTLDVEGMRRASIGGAKLEKGAQGWLSTTKRSENIMGDMMVASTQEQPLIYSVRFITVQRNLDTR